jgi:4'-phosphopantetheinyl transferase
MSYYIGLSILTTIQGDRRKGIERQRLGAEARRILSRFEGRPLKENDIAKEGQGRPFFPDREADFNIAHSGPLAAVSFVKGGNLRTGCDVEQVRPRANIGEIAEAFFSASERNYIFPRGRLNTSRFYEIWTLKECFLKLRGLSVFDMACSPSFISDEDPGRPKDAFSFGVSVSSPLTFNLYELSDGAGECYIMAAAIEGTNQERPKISWFSQSSLVCKSIAEIKAALNPAETVRPKM